ncbi:hypothetical protein NEMIN01_2350 [Nematocida minor]|uniref:uncharacterized protein n=1 Tax=Nematocida minor TaxID=1912983 RepID=UPI00221E897E|nr:uncharacterized protein NEMIN01_2350 [Nematocida minor]KAI5193006.1 hypothetical protein NEMIN01_2350 [Nematocida minor]
MAAKKEVRLVINIEGMVQTCLDENGMDAIKMIIKSNDKISNFTILKRILEKNIKIEEADDDQNQDIRSIVENDICQYFLYGKNVASETISQLNGAINNKDKESIRSHAIALANEIIMNPFIHNPEHGIKRKSEAVKQISSDASDDALGTRTCTLEIDNAKLPSLKSIVSSTTERLERDNFFAISKLVESTSMKPLRNFSPIKEIESSYTLDELYTKTYENTDELLINHGIKLINEKIHAIRNTMFYSKLGLITIGQQVCKMFDSEEDLRIVLSISEHIAQILSKEQPLHEEQILHEEQPSTENDSKKLSRTQKIIILAGIVLFLIASALFIAYSRNTTKLNRVS